MLLLGLAGCDDDVTPPDTFAPDSAGVRVSADLTGTAVASVEVLVVADAFAPELFAFDVEADAVSACVDVPLGLPLDVTVRARDAGGAETHSGALELTLQEGERVMQSLALDPLAGSSPIPVILSSVALRVAPGAATVGVGATLQLNATLRDCDDTVVTGDLTWETSDPAVATVSPAGLVSGESEGGAEITVEHGLLTDTAQITVEILTAPELQLVESGLTSPVLITAPPGDLSRLFVVQQNGVILILQGDEPLAPPFLDIGALVTFSGEQGLLGLAFHPEYATNGHFFVYYTDTNGDNRVVRYTVSGDPDVADAASDTLVLHIPHPDFGNHNGGMLAFGPDGMLYIAPGDGGGGGDPDENAQDLGVLLGKMLRIGVDALPYTIPTDNPFVGTAGARGEIWAYGLRNPWRFSFDRETGDLYIGDVGQGSWEEVNAQAAASGGGENYGWDIMEGTHCFEPMVGCDMTDLVLPVVEYANDGSTCAVTGGYVYRGSAVTSWIGHYLYADFCDGFVRSFRYEGGVAIDERDWTTDLAGLSQVSSFGEDAAGELYITTLGGNIYRIVPATP